MITILTTILRLISLQCFVEIRYAIDHIMQYKSIRNKGSMATKNVLKMTEFGAKPLISLFWISQSNDTNDSDDEPIN